MVRGNWERRAELASQRREENKAKRQAKEEKARKKAQAWKLKKEARDALVLCCIEYASCIPGLYNFFIEQVGLERNLVIYILTMSLTDHVILYKENKFKRADQLIRDVILSTTKKSKSKLNEVENYCFDLSKIPQFIQKTIFILLDESDLCKFMIVCKGFKLMVQKDEFSRRRLKKESQKYYQQEQKKNQKVKRSNLKRKKKNHLGEGKEYNTFLFD